MSDSKLARRPVNENRSVLLWLLFSVCTLGVYNLWFVNRWADDVNRMCDGDGDHTPELGYFLFFDILTFGVYKYVWLSLLADRLAENALRFGADECADGETVFLWFILCLPLFGIGPILAMALMISSTNSVACAYNAGLHTQLPALARAAVTPHPSEAVGALFGMAGTYRGCRVMIGSGECVVIGRDKAAADIVLKSAKISRQHCVVAYDAKAQAYSVLDVSRNGVAADGKRLTAGRQYTMYAGTILKLADGSEQFKLL